MSRIMISNEWWKKSVSLGHIALDYRDYDNAAVHYHRSFTHIETMYRFRGQTGVKFNIDLALPAMYIISCYNLADTFELSGNQELAQDYTEAAFRIMNIEVHHGSYCQYHQQQVLHNYHYTRDRLISYLRCHGLNETAISRHIESISRQTVLSSSKHSMKTFRECVPSITPYGLSSELKAMREKRQNVLRLVANNSLRP